LGYDYPGSNAAVAQVPAQRTYKAQNQTFTLNYILQDHLGSTSVTTNSSGGLEAAMRYLPFGGVRSSSGTLPTDKKVHRPAPGYHRPLLLQRPLLRRHDKAVH
jgi:hypothetical protein